MVGFGSMKSLLFMSFAFAAGAEGFALFAPYLICMMAVLYFARTRGQPVPTAAIGAAAAPSRRLAIEPAFDILPEAQPAM